MRAGLKPRILLGGVIAATGCLVIAGVGTATTTNADPTGDGKGGAPDITQVVASNDPTGVIAFRITTVAPITESSSVGIALDTDSNPATGAGGTEYLVIADTSGYGITKWNGSAFAVATVKSLSMTRSANVLTVRIKRSDLGVIDRFGYSVFAANYDANDAFLGEDVAPDGGEYVYNLSLAQCANGKDDDGDGKVDAKDLGCSSPTDKLESDDPVTLRASRPLTLPTIPKAGMPVVVGAAVIRFETGPLTSGAVRCAVSVGTKSLPAHGKVASGVASCEFTLPKASQGKVAHGAITVVVAGHSIRVPFTFKVT